ncbi:MAG: DUF488 domain-containing protein [Eggerthellaceae bacterium]|jgi:uncharacterized protein YeaO (DUF488 family)
MEIRIKRVYEPAEPDDGMRLLVDRLWPRGIKKVDLSFDDWPKCLCPSTEARKAFGHKAENFEWFASAYTAELDENPDAAAYVEKLREQNPQVITLLYAAKDPQVNHARVLKRWLEQRLGVSA